MTLGEERDLEKIKTCLTYVQSDKHSESPHWDASYPWKGDPAMLPDNRHAVEATFRNMEKCLQREPEWKAAYKEQIHDMISRGAAVKLSKDEIDNWKGPKWYISHLVAPNPHSSTTPVRIVWKSSQEFMGVSLNDLLYKGPDVLNQIRGVLLRFRTGLHAALCDVKKMYNSVWLEDREVHVHRFLWRDNPEDEMEVFAVVRVNMGDKPAGCIAQVAMRETANLPQFAAMVEERRVITEDSYVDDILTSHDNIEALENVTTGVEAILKAGGFFLKPWILSSQSGRSVDPANSSISEVTVCVPKTVVLSNQMQDKESKALGVCYEPEADKLRVMTSINFSKKRGKMRTGINLYEGQFRSNTPNPLTCRILLGQIARFYDPIGLATPAKQKGVMLVREAYQEMSKSNSSKDTWDDPLSPRLREASIRLFEEYVRLAQIRFERSLTPSGAIGQPLGITFSDGSEASYGAVLYLRWETRNGVVVRLVESKAKLSPLNQKGDVIKAEVCGAVFAIRLKKHFEKNCHIKVTRWIHFIDSQTILGAILKDSYGYQTFFVNRIGEIQKGGPVEDWRWVEGNLNISDIITRGASPEELDASSEWQQGPKFLRLPETEWPVKMASEITDAAKDVTRLQRRAFSAAVTRSQAKGGSGPTNADVGTDSTLHPPVKDQNPTPTVHQPKKRPWGVALARLVRPEQFSSLSKLCGTVAWVRRAAESWLNAIDQAPTSLKWEVRGPKLSAEERKVAFQDLTIAAQDGVTFQDTTLNRLVVFKDDSNGLLLCGGRVQSWTEEGAAVPLIPFQSWLATLLAREAHEANHEGVAATLLHTRRKAWVIQGRRVVKKVVNECVTCKKQRARLCQQVMSALPLECTNRANPFEYTTLDLFGPFEVRDAVKKRTRKKVWGVVYCCMASRAVHADLVDDQSSESFLQAYSRFTSLRGHPKKLWSDRGTNFLGARPALKELHRHLACLQKASVEDAAARNGTEWQWDFHPADSPHRNGAAEAAVKLIKRALNSLGGTTGFYTWGEFQTLLYSAANLTNERPIDARAQEQEDVVEYLTPNSLILGRTGHGGDLHGIDLETRSWRRLRAVQAGIDKFWAKWSELAGPNLFIRHKWHRAERNVKVGDVVWIADQNALRGQFRLGRVIATYPDKKNVVRDADIKTCVGLPAPVVAKAWRKESHMPTAIVIRRDVRRLVILIPVEDQQELRSPHHGYPKD
ncbi:BCAS3 microtubule associated cell migration factor isoform X1 [Festucalex cinctus]